MSRPATSARPGSPSPINAYLGFELVERDAAHAILRLVPRAELLQEEGLVQGGVLAGLAEETAGQVLLPELPPERSLTSIEFKLNFLRPARLSGGELVARAELVQRGRRVALCRVAVLQGRDEVALGLFTYLFLDAPGVA